MSNFARRPAETYDLDRMRTTPYPNALLEATLAMPETQARIINLIVRMTLGWASGGPRRRRASIRLTLAEIMERIDRSSSAPISQALDALVRKGVLEIQTRDGQMLSTPELRRRYHRPLYFRIARTYVESAQRSERPVDKAVDSRISAK